MVLAIEPMTTIGTTEITQADDGWSIYSQDGSLAAPSSSPSRSPPTGLAC